MDTSTELTVVIDADAEQPPFEQLRAQIADQVVTGRLPPHHRLPTVRRLATDVGLAANTVAKAYRELERAGIVETRGRHGTFVLAPADDEARRAADSFAERAAELGLTSDVALALVRDALARRAPAGS